MVDFVPNYEAFFKFQNETMNVIYPMKLTSVIETPQEDVGDPNYKNDGLSRLTFSKQYLIYKNCLHEQI